MTAPMSQRMAGVVAVLVTHGQNDGQHHLRWVVDQALRHAAGSADAYRAIIRAWEIEYGCEWETGVAP